MNPADLVSWLRTRAKEEQDKGDAYALEDLMGETAGQCFAKAEAFREAAAHVEDSGEGAHA